MNKPLKKILAVVSKDGQSPLPGSVEVKLILFKTSIVNKPLYTRFQARYKKIKRSYRREVELDLQVRPEEIMSRKVELGCESWTSFASSCSSCSSTAVQWTLSL